MSEERAIRLARLEGYRMEAGGLRVRLQGLRDSLRVFLDPDLPLREIKGDTVSQLGMEFWAVQQRYRETVDEIERIERDLGLRSGR